MAAPLKTSFARLGCGYVLISLVISCILLGLNGLIVTNLFTAAADSIPEFLRERRAAQAILFAGPVLLLVVQWWALDVTVDWFLPARPPRARK
jgi:hypothetical protein